MSLFDPIFYRMEYETASGMLYVEMPSFDEATLPKQEIVLNSIVSYIHHYQVSKLLLDLRETQVKISQAHYTELIRGFYKGLMTTRLEQVARLVRVDPIRERIIKDVFVSLSLPIQEQYFTDLAPAMA